MSLDRWLALTVITAIAGLSTGCGSKAIERPGYLVLARTVAGSDLAAGDTLTEVPRAQTPSPVVSQTGLIADSLRYPVVCTRIFTRPPHYLLLAEPFCGREPEYGAGSDDAFRTPEVRLMDADGQIIEAQGLGMMAFRILCPAMRRPDGSVYPRKPVRLDDCERWAFNVPLEELPEGISVPTGVILPRAVAGGMLDQCSRSVPPRADGEWTPRPDQIAALERNLPAYMVKAGAGQLPVPLAQYRRQYGGYVVGADSMIYVNAFLPAPLFDTLTDWHRRPMLICDGGEAYWGVSYDPAQRRYFGLAFNGHA